MINPYEAPEPNTVSSGESISRHGIRLSSRLTFMAKIVFPALLFSFLCIGMIATLSDAKLQRSFLQAVSGIVVCCFLTFRYLIPLKWVTMFDDRLVVRGGFSKMDFPFSHIREIRLYSFVIVHLVKIEYTYKYVRYTRFLGHFRMRPAPFFEYMKLLQDKVNNTELSENA